jgi:serine/threonine protein kinase
MKTIPLHNLRKSNSTKENEENRNKILKEFEIQRNLKHDNIAQVIDVYLDSDYNEKQSITNYYINIVMELCESDLQKYLDNSKQILEFYLPSNFEFVSMNWIPDLIEGLHYIHEQSIIHRDIKPGVINLILYKD